MGLCIGHYLQFCQSVLQLFYNRLLHMAGCRWWWLHESSKKDLNTGHKSPFWICPEPHGQYKILPVLQWIINVHVFLLMSQWRYARCFIILPLPSCPVRGECPDPMWHLWSSHLPPIMLKAWRISMWSGDTSKVWPHSAPLPTLTTLDPPCLPCTFPA